MLYVENYKNIKLTRGDTARLSVSIENGVSNSPYEMASTDTLTLTVRKRIGTMIVFQKKLTGSTQFHIEPQDTNELEFGDYKYDVQLETADGDVYTVIEPSLFRVMDEVTY